LVILAHWSREMKMKGSVSEVRTRSFAAGPAMHADAKQTELCTYLSAIMLVGLLLNTFFALSWGDPAAALIMLPIIAKEAIGGMQGKACDD
jgi:hypothetical protein